MTPFIRPYTGSDTATLCQLFYETVHGVNRADYTPAQLDAWAPKIPNADVWRQRMTENMTLVAEDATEIVGFGELADEGHIHMLFCRHDYVGRGVGGALLAALEAASPAGEQTFFTTYASLTARPFFTAQGYRLTRRRWFKRGGVELSNYLMEKQI